MFQKTLWVSGKVMRAYGINKNYIYKYIYIYIRRTSHHENEMCATPAPSRGGWLLGGRQRADYPYPNSIPLSWVKKTKWVQDTRTLSFGLLPTLAGSSSKNIEPSCAGSPVACGCQRIPLEISMSAYNELPVTRHEVVEGYVFVNICL